jgi:hypothetical protein
LAGIWSVKWQARGSLQERVKFTLVGGHYADHDFTAHDSAQRLRSTHPVGYRCLSVHEAETESQIADVEYPQADIDSFDRLFGRTAGFGLFCRKFVERGSYDVPIPMPSFAQAALDEKEWTKWRRYETTPETSNEYRECPLRIDPKMR